jgi:hypothetical protein
VASILILTSGTAFLAGLIVVGWRLHRAGMDLKGRSPIPRPFFLTGKAAMSIILLLFSIHLRSLEGGQTIVLNGPPSAFPGLNLQADAGCFPQCLMATVRKC